MSVSARHLEQRVECKQMSQTQGLPSRLRYNSLFWDEMHIVHNPSSVTSQGIQIGGSVKFLIVRRFQGAWEDDEEHGEAFGDEASELAQQGQQLCRGMWSKR